MENTSPEERSVTKDFEKQLSVQAAGRLEIDNEASHLTQQAKLSDGSKARTQVQKNQAIKKICLTSK